MSKRQEAYGLCKLCKNEGQVRHSHIFPEFLYERSYDEKHRAISIWPQSYHNEQILQKGLREYLLCQGCETHLSVFERYAAEVLRNLPSTAAHSPGDIVWVPGVDYRKFKVFQMSLLWRASIARQEAFAAVQLGAHEDRVRRLIQSGNPGRPWEYGCLLGTLRGPGSLEGTIKFPGKLRIEGHFTYHFVCWDLIWFYVVSSHASSFPGQGSFLSEDGALPIMVASE